MGVFANNAITDAGRILEGELKMGSVFTPTRIVMGSGFLPSGTTARTIKDVISPVISLQINKKNMSNNGIVVIGGVYSNAEIQSDFYFRELALYAKAVKSDGSATDEILYSYGNAGNAADLMPAYTSGTAVERQIDLATYVGIDIKVDLTIESGVYVTQKQLEDALNGDENVQQILNAHIANKQNPHGVTAAHVGAIPTAQKGAVNGVATLDSNKQLTSTQIPSSITKHIASRQNPHGVTAEQVGTYDKNEIVNLINNNISTSVVSGTYIGTSGTKYINLGFAPKAVLVFNKYGQTRDYNISADTTYDGGLAVTDNDVVKASYDSDSDAYIDYSLLSITTNGFNIHAIKASTNGYIGYIGPNISGTKYHYVAFK